MLNRKSWTFLPFFIYLQAHGLTCPLLTSLFFTYPHFLWSDSVLFPLSSWKRHSESLSVQHDNAPIAKQCWHETLLWQPVLCTVARRRAALCPCHFVQENILVRLFFWDQMKMYPQTDGWKVAIFSTQIYVLRGNLWMAFPPWGLGNILILCASLQYTQRGCSSCFESVGGWAAAPALLPCLTPGSELWLSVQHSAVAIIRSAYNKEPNSWPCCEELYL